jgi:hypothetical protein
VFEWLRPLGFLISRIPDRRKGCLFFPKPQKHLARTAKFLELSEDEPDRILYAQIRIYLDLFSPTKSNRKSYAKIAALRLLPDGT